MRAMMGLSRETLRIGLCGLSLFSLACAKTPWKPLAYPDPELPCPDRRLRWELEVLDRRASRHDSARIVPLLREAIARSFPGCLWKSPTGADEPKVTIEIHKLAAELEGDSWEAFAAWSVLVRDTGGKTLMEFETDEEASRPNYRGSNNALEALKQAFDQALKRTVEGLRTVSSAAKRCPPEVTWARLREASD